MNADQPRSGADDDLEHTVELEVDGQIATISLTRQAALNAITPGMLAELATALDEVRRDGDVKVVIFTGRGRAFSAGVDLKALGGVPIRFGSVGASLDAPARDVIERIVSLPKIVIAMVNGYCFTGALELAIACDLIVAADDAVLADTHAKWGLRPTWGMSQRLVKLIGVLRARELSYTARRVSGSEAAAWGLVNRAVPRAELEDVVRALAQEIAANSPEALAAYKDLYRVALDNGLSDGLALESSRQYAISDSEARLGLF